jgi:hypothetical protein
MKFYLLLFTCLSTPVACFAQHKIPKNDTCSCIMLINLKSPAYSEEDTITARVIVEITIDSNCKYSNPVIIKGASLGRNKAALDYATQYIAQHNQCNKKCSITRCKQCKKELPVTFLTDEEK